MTEPTTKPVKHESRWKPVLRLSAFCAVASACVLLWVQRRSNAERYFPRHIPGIEVASQWDSLTVNGQSFATSTGNTPMSIDEVLDSFQAWCRPRAGSLLQWKESLHAPHLPASAVDAEYPLVRFDDDGTGMATCVFLGEDPRIDLNARFLAAIRHDDIGLIGQIRHVYAYDNGAGSSYLMLWSEGSLRLDQFLPQEGDAPGLDVPGLPRPDDSRRLLSGSHDGGDKQVNAYTSRRSVDELRAGYEAGLSRSGYRVLPLETASSTALMALRGERLLWISLVEYEGLGTVATVVGDATSDPPAPEEKAWN